jgi:hypothetical protein
LAIGSPHEPFEANWKFLYSARKRDVPSKATFSPAISVNDGPKLENEPFVVNGVARAAAVTAAPRVVVGAGSLPPEVVPSHWYSVAGSVNRNGRTSVVTGPSNSVFVGPLDPQVDGDRRRLGGRGNRERGRAGEGQKATDRCFFMLEPPFPRGLSACGRRQVSWLPGATPSAPFPRRQRRPSGLPCGVRRACPVTVAGPRRILTGLPFTTDLGTGVS